MQINVQKCFQCGRAWHTSLPSCPFCASTDVAARQVDGTGAIYSWVEICRSLEEPPRPVPYTIIAVDLDVGARVFGRYEETEPPEAGARVTCTHIDHLHLDALSFKREEAHR